MVGAAGLTVTEATGIAMTLTAAVPLFPSLAAVIVTGPPTAIPVTSPVAETLATAELLEDQVTVRPDNALPAASRVDAVS
jgi:hypothetical protein